jgi:hypothetical protein
LRALTGAEAANVARVWINEAVAPATTAREKSRLFIMLIFLHRSISKDPNSAYRAFAGI